MEPPDRITQDSEITADAGKAAVSDPAGGGGSPPAGSHLHRLLREGYEGRIRSKENDLHYALLGGESGIGAALWALFGSGPWSVDLPDDTVTREIEIRHRQTLLGRACYDARLLGKGLSPDEIRAQRRVVVAQYNLLAYEEEGLSARLLRRWRDYLRRFLKSLGYVDDRSKVLPAPTLESVRFENGMLVKRYSPVPEYAPREREIEGLHWRWSDELARAGDVALLAALEPSDDPDEERLSELLRLVFDGLRPAEREGLLAILSGAPAEDAADRKRRSRARAAVKEILPSLGIVREV